MRHRWLLGAAVLVALAMGTGAALIWLTPREIARVPRADSVGSADRGAELALIGNCAACHTAPGSQPYAGGRALETNFGTLYAANITPSQTGTKGWSFAAFRRAMARGISRDGRFLYPAFPYDHFRGLRERDLQDLYAFVQSRPPVESSPPPNRLVWPLGFRPLLAGWRLLFLRGGTPQPDPTESQAWNRGRYLTETLAHCGACHTPRNALGAEEKSHAYDGGWSAGWYAPPLNATSPTPRAWTADDLYAYLRSGLSARHAAAAGPMGEVTQSLAAAPQADVRAIAVYMATLLPQADKAPPDRAAPLHDAAALYEGACATCHDPGAPMMQFGRPPLASGTALYENTPRDAMAIVLNGLRPPTGRAGPYMPAFGDMFDDRQIAALATYMRTRFSDALPWSGDLADEAARARKEAR